MSDATATSENLLTGFWDLLDRANIRWFQLVFYGFLLVWMASLLIVSWEWAWRDKLVPYIAGVPTIALLLVKIVKIAAPDLYDRIVPDFDFGDGQSASGETSELEETLSQIKEESDYARPRRERIAYAVRMLVWSMALPILMYTIGFSNALLLFVIAFGLRFYDSLRQVVIVTVVFSAFMYLFFYEIIGLQPWLGIFELPSIVRILGLG